MKDIETVADEMLESYREENLLQALNVLSDLEYVTGKEFKEPMKILSAIMEEIYTKEMD